MAEIDLTPTEQMASNAARGLELREKHGKGGTAVGVARARDIKNRKNLSPETVRRMHSFFSRHEGNQAGGEDDAGYIAWLLWGGDAGKSWAARKSAQLDKKEENAMHSETYKAIASRLGMAARPGAKAVMSKGVPPEVIASVRKAYDALMRDARQEEDDGNWRGASTRHQDAKNMDAILKNLQSGDGSAAHAKRISAMIYDLDTEVRDWLPQNVLTWVRSSVKAMASRPGAKSRHAIREGDKVSAADDAVSRKIRKLMDEGKPQKQAVAIALDLQRRGEL
jgi:hypothetical protein